MLEMAAKRSGFSKNKRYVFLEQPFRAGIVCKSYFAFTTAATCLLQTLERRCLCVVWLEAHRSCTLQQRASRFPCISWNYLKQWNLCVFSQPVLSSWPSARAACQLAPDREHTQRPWTQTKSGIPCYIEESESFESVCMAFETHTAHNGSWDNTSTSRKTRWPSFAYTYKEHVSFRGWGRVQQNVVILTHEKSYWNHLGT